MTRPALLRRYGRLGPRCATRRAPVFSAECAYGPLARSKLLKSELNPSPSLSETRLDKPFGEAGWKRDVGCSSRRGQCAGKRRGLDRLIGTIFREDYQRNNRPDWDVAGLNGEGQLPWCVPGTAPL